MKKIRQDSLTGKMAVRLLKGLGVGVAIMLILYFACIQFFYPYFLTSGYMERQEAELAEKFQQYVTENELAADDYTELKKWSDENGIVQMVISRENWILFDSTYGKEILAGARAASLQMMRQASVITFADGEGSVLIDDGYGKRYRSMILAFSVAAGVFVCLGIFAGGMHEDIRYIKVLEKEVSVISGGNLQKNVTIKGTDELADLAKGLDQMRCSLMEKERKEEEMRLAQQKLVLGMSHDLRTPLTGLLTYMEVLKQQQKEGKVTGEYIDKSLDKILQIRGLSDVMFEYFLVTGHKELEIEKPEEILSVFGDYLSELCSFLEYRSFSVNIDNLQWKPVCVSVNLEYIGRIFNNIISNLEKYAAGDQEVRLEILYEGERVGIRIQNGVRTDHTRIKGTGIGTKNIELMMKQMNGEMVSQKDKNHYEIILYFPIEKKLV